jgi:hypothetical protein
MCIGTQNSRKFYIYRKGKSVQEGGGGSADVIWGKKINKERNKGGNVTEKGKRKEKSKQKRKLGRENAKGINKWGEKVREEYKYSNVGTDIPEVKNIIFGAEGGHSFIFFITSGQIYA